jgi:hypothetical protein
MKCELSPGAVGWRVPFFGLFNKKEKMAGLKQTRIGRHATKQQQKYWPTSPVLRYYHAHVTFSFTLRYRHCGVARRAFSFTLRLMPLPYY